MRWCLLLAFLCIAKEIERTGWHDMAWHGMVKKLLAEGFFWVDGWFSTLILILLCMYRRRKIMDGIELNYMIINDFNEFPKVFACLCIHILENCQSMYVVNFKYGWLVI